MGHTKRRHRSTRDNHHIIDALVPNKILDARFIQDRLIIADAREIGI